MLKMASLLLFNDAIFVVDEQKLKINKPKNHSNHSEYVSLLLGDKLLNFNENKDTNILKTNSSMTLDLLNTAFYFKNGFISKTSHRENEIQFKVISILALHSALNYTNAEFELRIGQLDLQGKCLKQDTQWFVKKESYIYGSSSEDKVFQFEST